MTTSEFRRHQRILVPRALELRVAGSSGANGVTGVATVIGLGGMFVRTTARPPEGAVLQLALQCPFASLESACTVRYVGDNGVGIEFTGMSAENEEKLKALLVRLHA